MGGFQIQKFGGFLFLLWKIGHIEKRCEHKKRNAREGNVTDGQFGDWLRAERSYDSLKFSKK